MKFFKHFTDAHEGRSMQALMNKFGLEGYAAYFILTEICGKKFEKAAEEVIQEDHLKFSFNERIVREKLRMRSTKVELFLNYCVTLDLLQFTKVDDEYNFYFPKLLEALDRDTKRARTLRVVGAPKKKRKKKNKELEKEEDKDISPEARNLAPVTSLKSAWVKITDSISVEVPSDLIKSWADTYPKDFLNEEIKKARNWVLSNPQKAPKSAWTRFLNSWFERGWENYRKTLKSNPSAISVDDLNEMLGAS